MFESANESDDCLSWTNCTADVLLKNRTHCQPKEIRDAQGPVLINIGFVLFIGIIGNLLTVISLPYCWLKHADNKAFQSLWTTTTILMLHLSFCDLLYCFIGLVGYFELYYKGYYPHSNLMCWYWAAFRNLIAFANCHSVALIALNRCVGIIGVPLLKKPEVKCCLKSRRSNLAPLINGGLCILSIWMLALGIISPTVWGWIGRYGYDIRHGKCEAMYCKEGHYKVGFLWTTMTGYFIPCLLIFICHILIGIYIYIKKKDSILEKSQRQVDSARIGRTLTMLSFSYLVFILPVMVFENMGPDTVGLNRELWTLLAYNWFWWMFCSNFILYLVTLPRFREAYYAFLNDVKNAIYSLMSWYFKY